MGPGYAMATTCMLPLPALDHSSDSCTAISLPRPLLAPVTKQKLFLLKKSIMLKGQKVSELDTCIYNELGVARVFIKACGKGEGDQNLLCKYMHHGLLQQKQFLPGYWSEQGIREGDSCAVVSGMVQSR